MRLPNDETQGRRLRIGSLFSGYGGLDLAVEEVFDGETVWFSEFSPAPARVFVHHWPGVPNLGDITTIDWREVEPVDVICGGFPCQDVSTVGKRAGLHPGTRSGLWARMAEAIDVLQPEWVVAENVRGLLSAAATRPTPEGDNPDGRNCEPAIPDGTVRGVEPDPWDMGDQPARPLRAWAAPFIRSGRSVSRGFRFDGCTAERTRPGVGSRAMSADADGCTRSSSRRSRPGRAAVSRSC